MEKKEITVGYYLIFVSQNKPEYLAPLAKYSIILFGQTFPSEIAELFFVLKLNYDVFLIVKHIV